MLEVNKNVDWGFFFLFFGGCLLAFNAIIGMINFSIIGTYMYFVDGFGFFVFLGLDWQPFLGASLNIFIGLLAVFSGFKLFILPIRNLMTKIDVAIVGLVFILLGIGSFSTGGLILLIGGVYCFIYRLTVEGANNPKGK